MIASDLLSLVAEDLNGIDPRGSARRQYCGHRCRSDEQSEAASNRNGVHRLRLVQQTAHPTRCDEGENQSCGGPGQYRPCRLSQNKASQLRLIRAKSDANAKFLLA